MFRSFRQILLNSSPLQQTSRMSYLKSFIFKGNEISNCREIGFVNQKMEQQIPSSMSALKTIYNYVKYPQKHKYSLIIIELSKLLRSNQDNSQSQKVNSQLIDLAVCTENVNLAIYLHASLSNFKNIIKDQNYIVAKILEKTLSNKKLVLSGDFFHVKASSLSSKIGYIEIPQYFSKIEENVSKGMIIQETLNKRMLKNEPVEQKEVERMIELRDTSLISYSLKCLGVIIQLNQQDQEQLYQIGVTIGRILHLKHSLILNKQLPEGLIKLELLKLFKSEKESVETTEEQVKIEKQKLIQQLKMQLQKFKIEEQKINEFVRLI
ncbi:hypothetical protein ABPG74_004465 [Tetrahymena malaccensis]